MVVIAFAIVYLVWGSTYFFIRMAVQSIPPLLLGGMRFTAAGLLLLFWCALKGEKLFVKANIMHAGIGGILLLCAGNGVVIWVEQTLPSAMVAIMLSSAPIWFVLLDWPNWRVNLRNNATILGLIIGFAGVILLFSQQLGNIFAPAAGAVSKLPGLILLIIATLGWTSGSLYAKYNSTQGSGSVNAAWQMLIAGLAFFPASFIHGEFRHTQLQQISTSSWLALVYLIIFGSIAGFSAYVWLLQVRPATQVSTYAYVNPVIAVILGVFFAHEDINRLQIVGLVVILASVLLINLNKYRNVLITKAA